MDEPDFDAAAAARFGVPGLFGYQRQIVGEIVAACRSGDESAGTDEAQPRGLIILPTGAGKSLCYMLPSLFIDGYTLILYPLNALINDQLRRFSQAGIAAVALSGGSSRSESEGLAARIASGRIRVLLTNPETLCTPRIAAIIRAVAPRHIVFDEAHTVAEWGESFRPAYIEAVAFLRSLPAARVSAFTATATPELLPRITRLIFGERGFSLTSRRPARRNIAYSLLRVSCPQARLIELLRENEIAYPAIIFCRTRRLTEVTALRAGFALGREAVRFYHAGLPRERKITTEAWFMAGGRRLLAATCAFGLGVDCPGVRTVIHLSPPPSVEAYLQESGRAGRDGEPSRALLLLPPTPLADGSTSREAALVSALTGEKQCLQAALMRLFEPEDPGEPCGVCDLCRGREPYDRLPEEALLRAVRRMPGLMSRGDAADLLKGYITPGIAAAGIDGSAEFGALVSWDYEWIEELIEAALCDGSLRLRGRRGGRLLPGRSSSRR